MYRLFGTDGRLLYIGVTAQPEKRWRQHAGEKIWWDDVADIRMERYPDRACALLAEQAAIIEEKPRYNRLHNGRNAVIPGDDDLGDDASLVPAGLSPLEAAAFAAQAHREITAKRDDLIREASQAGGSLREIAAHVGMSNPGVLRVIRREPTPPPSTHTQTQEQP